MRDLALILLLAGCPEETASPVAAPKPDDPIAHGWKVSGHVLAPGTMLTDTDADALVGRAVDITATGYTTPWHGTCESATREHRVKALAEVTASLKVDRDAVKALGLADPLDEYRLTCTDNTRAPAFVLWLSGSHALTCWSGACYALTR